MLQRLLTNKLEHFITRGTRADQLREPEVRSPLGPLLQPKYLRPPSR